MDSVTGGSKNCFSLLVLRGTMRGKIMKWLGVIEESARNVTWVTTLVFGVVRCVGQACLLWVPLTSRMVVNAATGGQKKCSRSSLSVVRGTMPGRL